MVEAAAEPGTGLTLVQMPDAEPAVHQLIMAAIHAKARIASDRLCIKMPKVEGMVTVVSGNERAKQVVEQVQRAFVQRKKGGVQHRHHYIASSRQINWLSEEGLAHMSPLLTSFQGWVVIKQSFATALSAQAAHVLVKMDAMARAADTRVMFFVSGLSDHESLSSYCRDLWTIALCDAEEGTQCVFTVDCAGLSALGALRTSQRMVRISTGASGLEVRTEQFLALKLHIRLMAKLVAAGATMTEIAKAYGCDKSTVSRSLKSVPLWTGDTRKTSKDVLLKQLAALSPKALNEEKLAVEFDL